MGIIKRRICPIHQMAAPEAKSAVSDCIMLIMPWNRKSFELCRIGNFLTFLLLFPKRYCLHGQTND